METSIYDNLLSNVLKHTVDTEEAKAEFLAYKKNNIGLSVGFMEQRLESDLPYNSKEQKLLKKIQEFSYEYHKLDEDFNYAYPENEFM